MMWLKSLKIITWLASVGLISSALALSYIVLFPVNVLDDWQLRIAQDNYTLGDTVVIESLYTKNIDTSGKSTSSRYLECKNHNGVFVRYLMNEAVADRAKASSTGTGVIVVIPKDIAEVDLPTECFFSISINYDVYPRRAESEYARTQTFILKPKEDEPTQVEVPVEIPATEQSAQPAGGDTDVTTKEASQPVAQAAPIEPQQPVQEAQPAYRGVLDVVVAPINGLLKGIGVR